jgi:hypothetical protein
VKKYRHSHTTWKMINAAYLINHINSRLLNFTALTTWNIWYAEKCPSPTTYSPKLQTTQGGAEKDCIHHLCPHTSPVRPRLPPFLNQICSSLPTLCRGIWYFISLATLSDHSKSNSYKVGIYEYLMSIFES